MSSKRKTCCDCGSADLVTRKPRCKTCHNAYNRERYHANPNSLIVRKALYQKHAEKRRAEAQEHKKANPEYYALAEWFRKKGIPISGIDTKTVSDLIDMKKALKASKAAVKQLTPSVQ